MIKIYEKQTKTTPRNNVAVYDPEKMELYILLSDRTLSANPDNELYLDEAHMHLLDFAIRKFCNESEFHASHYVDSKKKSLSAATFSRRMTIIREVLERAELPLIAETGYKRNKRYVFFNEYPEEMTNEIEDERFRALEDLYPQNIIGSDGYVVEPAWDLKIIPEKLISGSYKEPVLLYAGGGMGKTQYTLQLYIKIKSTFRNVYRIPLTALLREPHIREVKLTDDPYTKGGRDYVTGRYNSYIMQYLKRDTPFGGSKKKNGGRTILILDGLNELIDQHDPYDIYTAVLNEIRCFCQSPGCTVLITSRSKNDLQFLDDIETSLSFKKLVLSPIQHGNTSATEIKDFNPLIKELLAIPLFYKAYLNYSSKLKGEKKTAGISSKYQFLLLLYRASYQQNIENKDRTNTDLFTYLYIFLLPLIAYEQAVDRTDYSDLDDMKNLMEETKGAEPCIQEFAKELGIKVKQWPIAQPTIEDVLTLLQYIDVVQFDAEHGQIRFHQEWREFLASMYGITVIKTIQTAARLPKVIRSFNLPAVVQQTVVEELGLNAPEETRCARLTKLLAIPEPPEYGELRYNKLKPKMYAAVMQLDAVFQLTDHFTIRLTDARRGIMDPWMRLLLKYSKSEDDFREWFDKTHRLALLSALAGAIRYHREKNEFKECTRYYQMAENLGLHEMEQDGLKGHIYRLLEHQRGKADILKGAYLINEKKNPAGAKVAEMGIATLESVATVNMAANLLGCIYGTPNYWIRRSLGRQPDKLRAFQVYDASFKEMTRSTSRFTLKGTELAYTGRQELSLLLKGYIQIGEDGKLYLNTEYEPPTEKTLQLAETILQHLEGEDLPFFNWLRGMARLWRIYRNEIDQKDTSRDPLLLDQAMDLFDLEKDNYMRRLLFVSGALNRHDRGRRNDTPATSTKNAKTAGEIEKEKLDSKLNEYLDNMGNQKDPEKTDTGYLIEDAKQLLAMLNKAKKKAEGHGIFAHVDETLLSDAISIIKDAEKKTARFRKSRQ